MTRTLWMPNTLAIFVMFCSSWYIATIAALRSTSSSPIPINSLCSSSATWRGSFGGSTLSTSPVLRDLTVTSNALLLLLVLMSLYLLLVILRKQDHPDAERGTWPQGWPWCWCSAPASAFFLVMDAEALGFPPIQFATCFRVIFRYGASALAAMFGHSADACGSKSENLSEKES